MQSSGIVRSVDDFGRIPIPWEIRRRIGITEGTPIEFFFDAASQTIYLKKYNYNKATSTIIEEALVRLKDNDELSTSTRLAITQKLNEALVLLIGDET